MTKKEAVEILQNYAQYYVPTGYLPALEMAIDALIDSKVKERCKIYARVPVECKKYLKDVAEKAGIPMSEYLTRLIFKDMGKKYDEG